MTHYTTKCEDLDIDEIVENYIRLKNNERERNKNSYEKLKEITEKYHERLNKNYISQIDYIELQKSDEEKHKQYKERRKIINKKAYERRKALF